MKIVSVRFGDGYLLTVDFDNYRSITLDMRRKLHTARFSGLNDVNLFRQAKTDGRSISWPNGISISTTEIYELLSK